MPNLSNLVYIPPFRQAHPCKDKIHEVEMWLQAWEKRSQCRSVQVMDEPSETRHRRKGDWKK